MKRKHVREAASSRATAELDAENPHWDAATFGRALSGEQRRRIIAGKLQPGDIAALRRFVQLTQIQFAEALGISMRTLQNWEQDRTTPDGAGLALIRIAARHPRIIRGNISTAA